MTGKALPLAAVTVLAVVTLAHSREVPAWSVAKLTSDRIGLVVATAISTKDTGGIPISTQLKLLPVNTVLKVDSVLKGEHIGHQLTVLHYRADSQPGVPCLVINGPNLVTFRTDGIELKGPNGVGGTSTPNYLLFLKKKK